MPSMDTSDSTKYNTLIEKLRSNVQFITTREYTDEYLLRLLKAKNYDLQKAQEMFRFIYYARQIYDVDNITKHYHTPKIIKDHGFATFMGFDKDGSPIQYIALGNADFEGFLRAMNVFDIGLYCSHCIETLVEQQKLNDIKIGRKREGNISTIMDFENFSVPQIMAKFIIETGLDLMRMFQETYPGLVYRIYLVNVPSYFSVIFNIFKPILKMDIIEKLVICSKENTPSELLKYIDADVLPAFLGGNRVDGNGDTRCSAELKCGSKVPVEDYGAYKTFLNVTEPGVSQMIIPARSTVDLQFEVLEPKSILHVEMWSDNTFGLSLYYKNSSDSNEEFIENDVNRQRFSTDESISPYAKIHCHLVPADVRIFCSRVGSYIFRFDNTFSWLSAKNVVYRINVLPPSADSPSNEDLINNN